MLFDVDFDKARKPTQPDHLFERLGVTIVSGVSQNNDAPKVSRVVVVSAHGVFDVKERLERTRFQLLGSVRELPTAHEQNSLLVVTDKDLFQNKAAIRRNPSGLN